VIPTKLLGIALTHKMLRNVRLISTALLLHNPMHHDL